MKKTTYQGKYIEVSEERYDDGHVYERASLRPGIRVFPIQNGKLLTIKEYRRHEGVVRWKFVGGWVDKEALTDLEIAKEELEEEVGMSAEKWEEFYHSDTPHATVNSATRFFIARGIQSIDAPKTNPDHDEIQETKWISLDELWELIDQKEMWWDRDAIVALQALRLYET